MRAAVGDVVMSAQKKRWGISIWDNQRKNVGIVFLALIAVVGAFKAFVVNREYQLMPTGITTIAYYWCDDNHVVVESYPDIPDGPKVIHYLTISDKISVTDVLPVDKKGDSILANVISCHDDELLLIKVPTVSERHKEYYTMVLGQPAQLLAELKSGGAAISLQNKYIVSTREQTWVGDHYDVDSECANYVRSDYKLLCWSPIPLIQNKFYLLSKYVLVDYSWTNKTAVRVPGENFFKQVENQELPIVPGTALDQVNMGQLERGKNGIPNVGKLQPVSDILLSDQTGNLWARLGDDVAYLVMKGKEMPSPNEDYLYVPCDKRGEGDWTSHGIRVCRFKLDGKQNQWEEVFAPAETAQGKRLIQEIAVDEGGNVYYDLATKSSDPNQGIWKYEAKTGKITQINNSFVKFGVISSSLKVAPGGKRLSFIGIDHGEKLFILQPRNLGDVK